MRSEFFDNITKIDKNLNTFNSDIIHELLSFTNVSVIKYLSKYIVKCFKLRDNKLLELTKHWVVVDFLLNQIITCN